MKAFLLIFLFAYALLAFENGNSYQCHAIKRNDVKLSLEEQKATAFDFYIKKDGTYLKTSRPLIYDLMKTKLQKQGKTYLAKVKSNGQIIHFKLKFVQDETLLRFVTVPGYGNLISEYVICNKK